MTWKNALLSTVALAALLACGVARDVAEHGGGGGGSCTSCHGDASRGGSALAQAAPATGAHLTHVARNAVACGSCHVVPTSAAHSNQAVEVTFAGVAEAKGAAPTFSGGTCSGVYCHGGAGSSVSWSAAALGCSGCHGAPPAAPHPTSTACNGCHSGTVKADGTIDVAGGLHANGVVEGPGGGGGAYHPAGWSTPSVHGRDAKQALATCQGCHGIALDGGTAGVSCAGCHTGGAAWISNCTFCHGTKSASYVGADLRKAAPPRGTDGETATTDRAVGAHQKHLAGGSIGRAVACAECHEVPSDLSHLDGSATITFGAAASRDGANPVWNGATCASTYCHGGTLGGGTNRTPSWTGADQAGCGACHGLPPPAPHSSSTACAGCHGYDGGSLDVALHLNGTVDRVAGGTHPSGWSARDQHGYEVNRTGLSSCKGCHGTALTGGAGPSCGSCHTGGTAWATSCTFCHGTGTQAAPPVDTQGRSATTNVSVGLHAAHLGTALMSAPACTECHPSRTSSNVVTDAAHLDGDGVAEVAFGTLARTGGAPAAYARTSATAATCASTYCHGRFSGGASSGAGVTMGWTSTTQVGCTSCHGIAPSTGRHSKSEHRSCGDCHPGYTSTTVNRTTHVNGTKQVGNRVTSYNPTTRSCSNSCHGSKTW